MLSYTRERFLGVEERSGKSGSKSNVPLDEMVCRGFQLAPFDGSGENVIECIIADPPYAEPSFYNCQYIREFLYAVDKMGKLAQSNVAVATGCYCLWFGESATLGNIILYYSLL